MPVGIDHVVTMIESIAPRELAYDWDNSGLLLRCGNTVRSMLITLDVTQAVVDEAIASKCDMILAHHPAIFEPMRALSVDRPADALIMRLIKSGISLYAAHTSYDRAPGGMNDVLAQRLGLCDIAVVGGSGEELMRTGYLSQPMSRTAFLDHIKKALGIKYLKTSRCVCDTISGVAVVGGSGGSFLAAAKEAGVDALITGEAKHHHFIEAESMGVLLAEAGHYDTERWFVDDVFMSLQARVNEVQLDLGLKKAVAETTPYVYQ